MTLTTAQKKLADFVKSQPDQTVYGPELDRNYDARVIENLLQKKVLERVGKSYLRQDDMEMVYYHQYRLVDSEASKKAEKLKARRAKLMAELQKINQELND